MIVKEEMLNIKKSAREGEVSTGIILLPPGIKSYHLQARFTPLPTTNPVDRVKEVLPTHDRLPKGWPHVWFRPGGHQSSKASFPISRSMMTLSSCIGTE
mmetsp:Transcript_9270/g.40547  ORF Transcript_9270/g.40547 Transcript_9270/m.40547 type:complete len:99 (+) Transcript_9270:956-1252(+)